MKLISKRFYKYYILILSFISVSFCLKAQSEALSVGSFIINMGATNPNTIANGIKPYGMIYDLIRNHKVPVKWVISQTKVKDGVDFVYDGVQYKGGTFIIPAEFRNAAVNARITFWTGQGVVGVTTTSTLTVDVTETIKAAPRWTLDAQNGSIAEGYLINAGVTNTAFPGAYNWKLPSALNSCDDFFVMPHADPTWATHSNLLSWNLNSLGSIWAACHATSALENMVNPANRAQQTNFLTQKVAGLAGTSGNYALSNSLILWGSHAGGSVPYIHQFPSDPVAQYLGVTDAAHQNGSEQIDIPNQSATGGWNVGAKIIAYDPTQVNVTNPLRPDKTNAAALIVYGRGFDDPSRGYVMYQPAHSHNKGSVNDVAAQRAFWNFSFFQIQPKAPQLSFSGITGGQSINGGATITGLNVSASSPLAGITFTYQWSSSCGGTFSNPTGTTTNFTAPVVGATTSCVISCAVTDNCGRTSFQSFPVTILGAAPPTANPDVQSVDPGCGAVSLTYNVLSNDTEPDGQPMTLTNVTGVGNGNISFTASGNITYTSNAGFVGVETLTYTVCDNTSPAPLCSNGTYTINVGNPANVPNAVNDAFTIAEDAIGTFNVLANDLPVVSGPYVVSAITNGPSNGRVSINTDNTITYVPNADFAGTDNFTYRIVNSIGYSRTATVTVTVTNDACDGGTLQSGSAAATLVSGNEWLKVYTRPVNTGGTNLTNTLAYNINAGMNRLLVVAISAGGPNGIAAVPTVTWGGQALTSLSVNRIDNNRSHAFIFYLKESGIAGASGNNLIVNMGVPSYFGYVVHAAVYQNVDQTTTVQNAVSPDISGNSLASPITAAATANFAAGDQGIFVSGYSVNGGTAVATYSSVSTNWTGSATLFGGATSSSGAVGPYYGGVGVRNITTAATNETVSMTVTATNSLRPSITVVSIIPGGLTCAAIPNRAPLGMQDTATTNSSTAVIIPVATNDQLFGQPVTSVTISTAPSNGSATVIGNTIQYTPSGSFNGVATLQYTITTANGSDVVRVYINVTGTPINANDDTPAGALSGVVQTINVKANDIDPEGTASSTVTIAVNPKNGTATVNGSGQIVYTPNAGFTGNDTLSYSICEPAPACGVAACDTAKVFLTVQNRAPVANNDSKTILPCYTNTINLTGNDTDPENGALTVTNLSALSNPAAGTLVNNNDGTVTYSPAVGYTGTFTFTYTVTDNGVTPLVSAPATVTITVQNPVNTPPNAVNDAENTNMDQVLYFSVRDNDTDPENNPLTIPDITTPPLHGTASVNSVNGQIIYTPNPGFYGTDSLRYRICDIPILIVATCSSGPDLCDTATLIITVDAPNTVIAINDENSTWINTPVSGGTLGNDFDPQGDSPITFNGFIIGGTSYTSGTIAVSGFDMNGVPVPNAGTITINANGTYTFTPALNFTGVVNVPYSIRDNNLNTAVDTANLRITVNPLPGVANSVIANNDENRVFGGATVSSTLFANDRDPQSNPFTVTGYMYDTNGDGTPDGTGTLGAPVTVGGVTTSGLQVSNAGLLTINANGTYTFTPAPDFTGSIDVPYTICDNIVPPACATAILHIDVLVDANGPLNDPPQPGDDFAYTKINTPVTSTFITNDGDPNNDPVSLNGTTINTGGPATPIGAPVTTAKGGTVQYFANGTYTYTPPAGYVGPDSVEYEICDVTAVAPQPLCNKAFLHLLVGVSNTTDAINDENSTWQDVNVSGNVLNNDFDAEGHTQTFGSFLLQNQSGDLASGAVLGGVDKSGVPIANAGTLTFDANGNFTFDPDPAFTGTVTVPYRLCDNGNQSKCDTAFLTITVDPLPNTGLNSVIANNDENVSYGAAVGGSLFVNDRDPQNDAFTVTSFVGGTVGTPGVVAGVDLNGNPVANAGTLTINANGTYTFTPAPGFVGSINVPYTITDANGATSTAVLHIDVLSDPNGILNDPPVAGDDFGYTTINKPVTGNFISNDSDPNTDPVSYMGITINPAGPATPIGTPVTTAQGGTVQFYANGTYLYTPPVGYVGPDRLPYTICDVTAVLPQPLCADATLHLLVGPGINIAGRVWDDANGNVNINGGENFTNAGNTLYVNLVDGSGNVVATTPVAADGTYSFANINPGDNYSLQLSINQGTVGNPAPAVALPPGWTNTGENRNGTIDGGTPGVIDTRNFGFTNTINFDFGIEQLPNTNNHTTTIPQPIVGTVVVLNGGTNPPVLSGIDPEDCNASCTLTTRSVIIDAVPANSDLYYNGVLVTNGQLINNFDPNLLEIRMTAATVGSVSTSFQYSYVDLAGKKDPTPATYTLNWSFPLPITLASFTGIANKCDAVLQWKTSQEINADKFEVEQSNNGLNFTKLAEVKSANNANGRSYQLSVSQPNSLKYYRLKMLDKDGSYRYSPIITVRTNCTSADYLTVYPNPVSTNLTVSFQTAYKGQATLQIVNSVGQQMVNQKILVTSSANTINLDMTNYVPGLYLLSLLNDSGEKIGETQKIIKR